jgi:hypothetical protein
MPDDMERFRVDAEIENPARPRERQTLGSVLVDTWRFRQADGTILERPGPAPAAAAA